VKAWAGDRPAKTAATQIASGVDAAGGREEMTIVRV
jgi:hypothetical protein